jgi:hypothetical protein
MQLKFENMSSHAYKACLTNTQIAQRTNSAPFPTSPKHTEVKHSHGTKEYMLDLQTYEHN